MYLLLYQIEGKNRRLCQDIYRGNHRKNKKLYREAIFVAPLTNRKANKSKIEGEIMGINTKESIIEAAIILFNTNGFAGTSIRDIANKAQTNVSNISYYFQNKQGLLETCFTMYFEEYIRQIETGYLQFEHSVAVRLKNISKNIIQFQCNNLALTRLVQREISLDSQMIREIMSTYFVKERYYFNKLFEEGIHSKEFHSFSINYMIMQYKSLLQMPFLNTYYLTEVLHIFPNETFFSKKYYQEICRWIDGMLCINQKQLLPMVIS